MTMDFETLYQLYDYCMRTGYNYLHYQGILETEENRIKTNQYLWLAEIYKRALADYN